MWVFNYKGSSRLINYFPGVIILVFGMFALHSSMTLMRAHEKIDSAFRHYGTDVLALQEKFYEFELSFYGYAQAPSASGLENVVTEFSALNDDYEAMLKKGRTHVVSDEKYLGLLLEAQADIAKVADGVVALRDAAAKGGKQQDLFGSQLYVEIEDMHDSIRALQDYFFSSIDIQGTSEDLELRQSYLYWSVLLMGFSGFILILLNADKVRLMEKNAEERKKTLALLESRLAALEAARDGIMIIDPQGKLTFLNRAMCDIYSIKLEQRQIYMNQNWFTIFPQSDLDVVMDTIIPEIEEKGYWLGDFPLARVDGSMIYTEMSITRLPDGGMIGTTQDITEKYSAEKERKHLEDQFYQAQKMEAVGRLAGGMAHDFNNILAAMNGYAEFLVDDLDAKSEQHKFAKNILQAGRQARDLVDQMLAFSRRSNSTYETVDLITPLQETLVMLRASLPKSIEVESHLNLRVAPVHGNATQISQVLMNLCVNAKDAMESGSGHGMLTISLDEFLLDQNFSMERVVEDELPDPKKIPYINIEDIDAGHTQLLLGNLARGQRYARVTVRDTGTGMSHAIMEHIFEPFFTTKPVDKGTGLGLATVHGVIVSHRGFMVIDSVLGRGTLFELYFPMVSVQDRTEEENISKDIGTKSLGKKREIRVLLVEDQQNVRDMMLSMIERLGYEVFSCEDGLEALELIREEPEAFDLVITDHNMPKMTGLEMVQQVYVDFPEIPFILLSGYSEKELFDLMGTHPAIKAIMIKPANKEILGRKMEEIVHQSMRRSAA